MNKRNELSIPKAAFETDRSVFAKAA